MKKVSPVEELIVNNMELNKYSLGILLYLKAPLIKLENSEGKRSIISFRILKALSLLEDVKLCIFLSISGICKFYIVKQLKFELKI